MDDNAVTKDIQANPDRWDAVWHQNQADFQETAAVRLGPRTASRMSTQRSSH